MTYKYNCHFRLLSESMIKIGIKFMSKVNIVISIGDIKREI